MPAKKNKILVFCMLVAIGIIAFTYGAFCHSINVSPQKEDDSAIFAKSEPALIKDASVGGLRRDEFGSLKQTYDKTPPKACPT
jgi:hypothetical protein